MVQHCHFVPHEDHGLMAYHELLPPQEQDPIIPTTGPETPYEKINASEWVDDCVPFHGLSAIYAADSQTLILLYFKQFKYRGWCFFGFLPAVQFRTGRVSNAYVGFSFWGTSQNLWETNATMDGRALVFTLQAIENSTGDFNLLHEIYTSEVLLNKTRHTYDEIPDTTPTKCSDEALFNNGDNEETQFRAWYCVRPRTSNFPSGEFNVYNYEFGSDLPFGFSWSYGEGTFGDMIMHASRGACAMYFIINGTESTLNEQVSSDEIEIDDVFGCYQHATAVNNDRSQSVSVIVTTIPLVANVTDEAFMKFSGYNVSSIPEHDTDTGGDTSTTMIPDEMSTTEGSESTDGNVMVKVNECVLGIMMLAFVMYVFM